MKLNKNRFSRNRDRETQVGDVFSKTSTNLNAILSAVVAIFFTPTLVATSLLSKEIILMMANILLSLGFGSNFLYRIVQKEMSIAEFVVSFAALLVLGIATFLICSSALTLFVPSGSALTVLAVFNVANQIASGVNLFFLFRNFIVPPCKKALERVAAWFGFNIGGRYYYKPPLTLENDRFIIDRLLMSVYKHDSHASDYNDEELARLNALLHKLCDYIEKYDEALLGYFFNKDTIESLEKCIAQLTTEGVSDSSYSFIRKKISFKTTKKNLLSDAKLQLEASKNPEEAYKLTRGFFKAVPAVHTSEEKQSVALKGSQQIKDKIEHLDACIESLKACLPS